MGRYRWLFPYMKPFSLQLGLVLIIALVSTALTLSYPYFTSMLIDDVLISPIYSLKNVVGLAFGAMFAGYLFMVVNSLLYLRITLNMLRNLRYDLFYRIQQTKYHFFVHRKVGDLITRLNGDAAEVQGGLTDTILQGIIQICTLVFVSIMLFYLNWKLALISVLFIPLLVWAIAYFRPKIVTVSLQMREQHSMLQSFLIERLNGIKLIKLSVGEKRVANHFDLQIMDINKKSFNYSLLTTLAEGIPKVSMILSSILVFTLGGMDVLNEQMTVGALVAFTGYQSRLFGPVQSIAALYMRVQRMNVSLKRLEELFEETVEEPNGENNKRGESISGHDVENFENVRGKNQASLLLHFEKLSFKYPLSKEILKDINFSLGYGETAAIIGSSGIGKSTIIDLITGLYEPTNGKIFYRELPLSEWSLQELRREISVASQQAPLFNGSILENIRFSVPDATMEEVKEIAKLVGLHNQIKEMENGYNTRIGERGTALSGGQRQRLALARTLLKPASLYILDEATSELDEQSELNLYRRLKEDPRFQQLLIISHRPSTLDWVDAKWYMHGGGIFRAVGVEGETVG